MKRSKYFFNSSGVTIIELIVTLTVFFIILSVVFTIFISVTREQKSILGNQEFLNQINYVAESISRQAKFVIADSTGSCLGINFINYYYLLTSYDSQSGFYQGIKFIANDNNCYEFFLDSDGIFKQKQNNGSVQNIFSDKFKIKYVRFIINGDKTIQGFSQGDLLRPRITFSLNIETQTSLGQKEKIFQTTILRRDSEEFVDPINSCLLAGTKILTKGNVLINIEDVKVGDQVLGFDEKILENKLVKVTQIFKHENNLDYYIVFLEDGTQLKITGNHPVYVGFNNYKEVDNLKKGDNLFNAFGEKLKIVKIEFILKSSTVYNIETSDTHNYFANGILVHNKSIVECGNLICSLGEDCFICEVDCGSCSPPPPPPPICGGPCTCLWRCDGPDGQGNYAWNQLTAGCISGNPCTCSPPEPSAMECNASTSYQSITTDCSDQFLDQCLSPPPPPL